MKYLSCLLEHLAPATKYKKYRRNEQLSFPVSLARRPPLSRPPRHRFGPGRASLLSAAVSPVARLASSPVFTAPAVALQLDNFVNSDWVPPSMIFSPV